MLRYVIVLNSPDVDANVTLVDRSLLIPGVPPIFYPLIDKATQAVAAAAETLQVNTWTPGTWVDGKVYSFRIQQFSSTQNDYLPFDVTYTTVTADANVTAVCNRMRAIIRNYIAQSGLQVTVNADGAATIIITSAAGNHPFTSIDLLNGSTALTTAFVHSIGAPADVLASGAAAADVSSSTTYAGVVIKGYNKTADVIGSSDDQRVEYYIWADTADAGTAAWITAINDLLAADDGSGAVPLGAVSIQS